VAKRLRSSLENERLDLVVSSPLQTQMRKIFQSIYALEETLQALLKYKNIPVGQMKGPK